MCALIGETDRITLLEGDSWYALIGADVSACPRSPRQKHLVALAVDLYQVTAIPQLDGYDITGAEQVDFPLVRRISSSLVGGARRIAHPIGCRIDSRI